MTRTPQALRVGRPLTDEDWIRQHAGELEDEMPVTDPLIAHLRRLNIRGHELDEALRLYDQQRIALRAAPHDSAPGNPGPAPVKPGPTTSESGYTRWAVYAGIGIAGLFAVLAILSAFGYRVDLEYVKQLADLFQSVVIAVVGYAISRGLVKGGASIGAMRDRKP